LPIHRDASVYASLLSARQTLTHTLAPNRRAWLQVVKGELQVNGAALQAGDGVSVEGEPLLSLVANTDSELLLFDLS
jgi:redox-sensitive bicupin YhaK (pirin superfamily)